jgi:hypothetical protein
VHTRDYKAQQITPGK